MNNSISKKDKKKLKKAINEVHKVLGVYKIKKIDTFNFNVLPAVGGNFSSFELCYSAQIKKK